jgi:hypothetical protein
MAGVKETTKGTTGDAAKSKEATYALAGILKAKRYAGKTDLLCAVLSPSKRYTFAEVDELLEKFMKKKVG